MTAGRASAWRQHHRQQSSHRSNLVWINIMWKLLAGFAVFAALAIFILMKSGGNIDMGGEKHDVTAPHAEAPAASASELAVAAASAASN
jgi:hypothetical protein